MEKDKNFIKLFNEVINFKYFIISLVVTNVLLVASLWLLKKEGLKTEQLMGIGLAIILIEWVINAILIKPQRIVRVDQNGN